MQLRHVIFAGLAAIAMQFDIPSMGQPAIANAAALTTEQVAAFQSKLEQAEASRELLGRRSVCLMEHLTAQQQLSAERERALGEAMYLQIELERQVAQSETAVKGYEELVQSESENVRARQAVFEKARRERDEQAKRVTICSGVLFFLPGICQAGDAAVKALGWMNDAEREYRIAQPRLDNARTALEGVRNQLENNRRQLIAAQQSHAENQSAVKNLEEQITRLKAAISTINVKVQDFNIQVSNFTNALKEASEVNPDDAKIRQVDRLSAEIDGLTKDVPQFISSTEAGLPEDARKQCGS
ncbi:hypothetical protein [Rhizobium rhizogenes]|uniref:hypothetical protein n=1 Tax=Rhizobium rhizogenes TaxID=359 RepID=UPI0022C570CE|nr:hypothetical protein [Rhizobium rhizogenes]MCZ7467258.1 hypothetical protein [Rhizobium rhizogenes]